jgi:DNA polymerase-3 subunit epsilon
MKIEKPIVFFDVETTGLDISKDRIIELCMIKLMPDGDRKMWKARFNPEGVKSTEGAFGKHGIADDELTDEDTFSYLSVEVFAFITGCDVGGYNVTKFDLPILVEELLRAGIIYNYREVKIVDAFSIYAKMEPRTLEATYTKFTGKILENAHSAQYDIEATIEIFEKQMEMYSLESVEHADSLSIERESLADLAGKFKLKEGKILYNFGKYFGKEVKEVYQYDSGYLEWMGRSDSFSQETKIIAGKLLKRMQQEAKA